MTKSKIAVLAFSTLLLVVASCGEAASPLERARTERTAVVAAVPLAGPFIYQQEAQPAGPDYQLAKRIVEKVGTEVRMVVGSRTFAGLVPSVANGEVLCAVSALGVTEARKEQINFSQPYYTAEMSFIINPVHRPLDAPAAEDLNGMKLGVRKGSAVEEFARASYPGAEIVALASLDDAVLALRRKEVDVALDDRRMAAFSLATVTGAGFLELLPEVVGTYPVAVGIPPNSPDLEELINGVVTEVESEGLYQSWLEESLGDSLTQVAARYQQRKQRQEQAVEPRNVTIRISKDADYRFDIYKMANLRFSVRGGGQNLRSSRIDFRGPVGYASIQAPPGNYTFSLNEFGFNAGVEIRPTHPKNITVNIRLKESGVTLQVN
ncbi:MAG TPA: ABC transporter substrate-binding protein [Acidobacteriota bacterium]|nr:ABC transporter substrate-binding protein [Acidobacteriota bacterium]